MASVFSGIARSVSIVCDTVQIVDVVAKACQQDNANALEQPITQASLVNRLILLGFAVTDVGLLISGAKSETLMKLKSIEVIPRVVNLPLEILSQITEMGNSSRDVLNFIQKGIVAPMADIVRVSAQVNTYYEKHFLEMTPEELEKAKRPIYEEVVTIEGIEQVVVGYKPVSVEECEKNLKVSEAIATRASLVRAAMIALDASLPLYDRLFNFVRRVPAEGFVPDVQEEQAQQPEDLDFRGFSIIPVPLHQDEIFSRFICPITKIPIRDPVRDPTTSQNVNVLYERQAILNWLQVNQTSPITREILQPDQLVESPGLKLLIDRRLDHHYRALINHMNLHNNDPVSAEDQAIIQQHQ